MLLFQMEDNASEVDACDCLPDCNSITYQINVIKSSTEPEEGRNVNDTDYSGPFYYGAVSFSFGDIEYHALKRYANYKTISFICDVGGLLSLFLGVSLMSFIEIFYFFGFRMFVELLSHFKRRQQTRRITTDLRGTLNDLAFIN